MIQDTKKSKTGQVHWKRSGKPRPLMMNWGPRDQPSSVLHPLEIPEPALDHLARLTDDTGLLQHAKFTIPNRAHGYCTDDNARGAIAMARYYAQSADPRALRLLDVYLSFLMYAQDADGLIRNFMDFNRNWWEKNKPFERSGLFLV